MQQTPLSKSTLLLVFSFCCFSVLFLLAITSATKLYAQEAAFPSTLPDVKYHLTARPWRPSNISKTTYLDKVEGIVRAIVKFQNSSGAIIDPYANREVQYATPYFANAVATLLSSGRAMDLLEEGVAAMNKSTTDIDMANSPDNHDEFFLAPLATAIPLYMPFIAASQIQIWEEKMGKPVQDLIRNLTHNWRSYAMKGEWYRAKKGYVNKDSALKWLEDNWVSTQKSSLTKSTFNFYHDGYSDPLPWAYESVARANLLAMVADGYDGASRVEMLTLLKRGTQFSLLMQDPSGQCAAGGRSGNHTWNDILAANGYEIMAELAYKEGNTRLAGQYRHAAALGFESAQRWRRADGAYSVTKNHFDQANRIGYASYSFFTNYNGNMMYHMAENYLRHKTVIPEQPVPAQIGGYTIVSDDALATAVANAGGMQMQVGLRGSTAVQYTRYWNALGVVRFSRAGWDSRLGPSDGVRDASNKYGVSFAPTFLENGAWLRLASMPDRYEAFFTTQFTHPLLVRCRIDYKPRRGKTGPVFTNHFTITPDGILSTLTSTTTNFGITWPVLVYDGAVNLQKRLTTHIASTSFSEGSDQQNFIALHATPTLTATDALRRSAYGDLLPVRMVSGTTSNVTFIYPRNAGDPAADLVQKSFAGSSQDFSTILGRVIGGSIYIGRTSAGGKGTGIDIDNDGTKEATFNVATGFLMELRQGEILKLETDRAVTAVVYGQTVTLKAYTPVNIYNPFKTTITQVIASAEQEGNVAANTIDGNYNTRWAASGQGQWLQFYLDTITPIRAAKIAWYRGNERQAFFDIQVSLDNNNWRPIFNGHSSGQTTAFETYPMGVSARSIRITCRGNSINDWNSILDVKFVRSCLKTIEHNTYGR